MPDWLESLPFAVALVVLYLGATVRGQLIYWLGRWAARGAIGTGDVGPRRQKLRAWLSGAEVERGRRAVEKWGLPIIPLSYLTVGFQSLVHAAAGVLRVSWPAFTLVQIPGALAWGLIYSTIGFAAWEAALAAAAGSPAGLAVIALLVVAIVALIVRRRRRRASATDDRVS
ncbi:DedA family protein [Nigerium massiliense]|uniref:DedA family protein n=1 Tax=Nigerium massiliense TaxID=1522317 RepID=UPI0005914DD8|nr:VTT domain-containing protein [Nigerium massiliense]